MGGEDRGGWRVLFELQIDGAGGTGGEFQRLKEDEVVGEDGILGITAGDLVCGDGFREEDADAGLSALL